MRGRTTVRPETFVSTCRKGRVAGRRIAPPNFFESEWIDLRFFSRNASSPFFFFFFFFFMRGPPRAHEQRERATPALAGARNLHRTTVRLGNGLDDGEAQSGRAFAGRGFGGKTLEALEGKPDVISAQALAAVGNTHVGEPRTSIDARLHHDRAARRRILRRMLSRLSMASMRRSSSATMRPACSKRLRRSRKLLCLSAAAWFRPIAARTGSARSTSVQPQRDRACFSPGRGKQIGDHLLHAICRPA